MIAVHADEPRRRLGLRVPERVRAAAAVPVSDLLPGLPVVGRLYPVLPRVRRLPPQHDVIDLHLLTEVDVDPLRIAELARPPRRWIAVDRVVCRVLRRLDRGRDGGCAPCEIDN